MVSFVIHTFGDERLSNLESVLVSVNKHKSDNISEYIIIEQNGNYAETLANDYEFTYIRVDNDSNSRSSSRNIIMNVINTDYVIIHDADLIIFDNFFDNILNKIYDGYKFIANFGKVINLTENQTYKVYSNDDNKYLLYVGDNKVRPYSLDSSCGGSNTVYMPYYTDIDGYDESFIGWGFEDIDFAHRMIMKCGFDEYCVCDDNILYHTHHEHSMVKKDFSYNKKLWEKTKVTWDKWVGVNI